MSFLYSSLLCGKYMFIITTHFYWCFDEWKCMIGPYDFFSFIYPTLSSLNILSFCKEIPCSMEVFTVEPAIWNTSIAWNAVFSFQMPDSTVCVIITDIINLRRINHGELSYNIKIRKYNEFQHFDDVWTG
jgi:hypothetical protein